jgi:hypothetical protein
MNKLSPRQLILLGFALLMLGFMLPFLMVLRLLGSTLFLNFVAYLASLFGLIIGLIGIVMDAQTRSKDRDES